MFLKELEIYGFKSFAKKIKFSFNSGITAIVGPNGCGKSNITDAIRWVLGEQNIRALRGKQLTDIIFSGNHNEKPLNVAEVSLVLNNSEKFLPVDWEEINIKRRIYRSGETENFINGIPCKLREIQELFMNTGLGKNAYSIIAQGEIDLVLSAKPSERRYLFEEAASISKYKYEKQRTLKKIEETDNNLDKIINIISEIKNQLIILEEEAKHLNKYKICQEKIRDLELFLIYQKYNLYKTNLSKIMKKLELYEKNKEKILINTKEQELKINTLNGELISLKREQEKYKYENYELNDRKKSIQNEFNLMSQKKIDFEKRLIDLNKEIEDINQKISFLNKSKKEINMNILKINKKLKDFNGKLSDLEKEFKKKSKFINSITLTRNNFKKVLKSFYEKELFLKEREIKYKTTLNIINLNLDKIRERKKLLEKQLKVMVKKENDCRRIIKESGKNIERSQLKKNEERIKEIESILNRLRLSLEKDNQGINLKEERRDILIKSIKHYLKINEDKIELFYSKYNQGNPDGICKKLIKLIDYIPQKYEKIIEIALKENLNSIVVNDIYFALNIISSLPKNELNEIKLMPLDLIKKAKVLSEDKVKIHGENICGFADELITYSKIYHDLFKVLLGNILIVENTQTALNFSKKYLGKYKIIALNSIVIDFDGSINIPLNTKGKQENVFYIEREIERLTKEIENLKIQVRKNENSIEEYNNIYNSLTKENNEIKKLLQENEKDNINKIDNLNKTIISINELERTLKNLTSEEDNILKEKKIISKRYYIFEKKYNELSKYNTNIDNTIKIVNNIIIQKNNYVDNITKDVNNVNNFILVNKEKMINLRDKDENASSYLNEYISDLEEKKNIIKEYNKNLNMILNKIEEYTVQLKKLNFQDSSFIKKKDELKRIIQEETTLLKNSIYEKDKQQKLYEEIKDEKHKVEILEVQYQEKYENIENEVMKNYKLPVEKLILYNNKATSQKVANHKIDILRDNILKMGQINFDAESRYQNQLKRYNSLWEKYNEIYQARRSLAEIISEIDQIALKRFKETFDKVNIHFNNIFKKMFSGGEAKLFLSFEKDVLQSGIDIIARPPGKRTQNIELLSSGEKAITAIALLLALWKVNPSPFCFFDEIDTALDEVNAEKLAFLLKGEELNQPQLIIITHQRSTMEAADTLYGITMEESGISKLVSVKFQN
ncbi:MAG: chromosome segregation protein SMC [Candidatus Atribacteria bacterium]